MQKLTMEELKRLTREEYQRAEKLPLRIVLDNIRSLNNIGSIFRTGDAFRVMQIDLCGITATPPHREIHKTALGAEETVEWSYYSTTKECLMELKEQGYYVLAIEQVDESIKLDDYVLEREKRPIAIIMGNEVEGVDGELLPYCDGVIEIPQFGTKHSLNVSCAAAIVIWEIFKQMGIK